MKTFQSYFEDTATDLAKALDSHDWSYEMSDDHRYYVSGERSYSNIKSLIEKMVREGQDREAKEILDTCEYPYKDKRFIEPFYNYLFAVKNKPKETNKPKSTIDRVYSSLAKSSNGKSINIYAYKDIDGSIHVKKDINKKNIIDKVVNSEDEAKKLFDQISHEK